VAKKWGAEGSPSTAPSNQPIRKAASERTGCCAARPAGCCWTHQRLAHPAVPPLSASSGQRFAYSFLQIPPRDRHPCRSANTSPCRACRGLSPPSECALPGAPKKAAPRGTAES